MPSVTRRSLLAARAALLATVVLARGRSRIVALALHEALRIGPAILRNGSGYGPVARRFRTSERTVWLTIDDGPDPQTTPDLLDVLAAHRARASFFCIGRRVAWNAGLARRIATGGHTLENHSFSHPSALFWALPACMVRSEIVRCQHAIASATGTQPHWFRSPVGMTNEHVHPVAAAAWLRVAGWSADGRDGLPGRDPAIVVSRVLRQVAPGAILLIHEGPGRRAAEVADLLLAELAARDLRCLIPSPASVG